MGSTNAAEDMSKPRKPETNVRKSTVQGAKSIINGVKETTKKHIKYADQISWHLINMQLHA